MLSPVGKLVPLGHWIREHFHIDWQQRRVTCPQGQQSSAWYLNQDAKGESIVQIFFPKQICQACPVREKCTDAQKTGRSMTLRFPEVRHELLQAARVRQPAGGV